MEFYFEYSYDVLKCAEKLIVYGVSFSFLTIEDGYTLNVHGKIPQDVLTFLQKNSV
jgi:hypothetical protein